MFFSLASIFRVYFIIILSSAIDVSSITEIDTAPLHNRPISPGRQRKYIRAYIRIVRIIKK